MASVIRFLEAMGSNPDLSSRPAYAESVAALDVEDDQRQALMDRDRDTLGVLLGARAGMRCIIWSSPDSPA